ncbi:MAG: glycosyltransferase [Candidatus Aegiribacteria sp.]|nr:glycosyltransferase [Candidatus Aegiribacteria sp.]MBD3295306.1 glycosyltransferase [Candidatus Fermentibacteria bacterium]
MQHDFSIVITTYNSASTLEDTLLSIRELDDTESPVETVVVDNASEDVSAEIAEGFPGVRLIRTDRNLGLARANNIGASEVSGKSILFLNPDARLKSGTPLKFMEFEASHSDAALLGPRIIDSGGRWQSSARTYPTPFDIALRRTPLGRLSCFQSRLDRHMFPVSEMTPASVDWLSGAALWLTSAGKKNIGLMSERYFLYFEDVQWCMRANRAGMKVWYVPEAVVIHEGRRESSRGLSKALWFHLMSMIRFFCEFPCALAGSCNKSKGDRSY